jgi:hypothetical protein
MQVFSEHPLGGVGPGNFEVTAGAYLDRPRPAHNAFIAVVVEQGIVGVVLFSAMFVVPLPGLRYMSRVDRRFWGVLMLTLFVGLQPRNWDYKKPTWLVLTLFAAAGASARERRMREAEKHRVARIQWQRSRGISRELVEMQTGAAGHEWLPGPHSPRL